MNKYLIINFMPTLGKYQTRNKYIPFNFFNVFLELKLENYQEVIKVINNHSYLLENTTSPEEEYNKFQNFYNKVLIELEVKNYTINDIKKVTSGQVGNIHKVIYNSNINDYLRKLSLKYKLILLIDDFPSIEGSLTYKDIAKYFDEIYITSCYKSKNCKELFNIIKDKYEKYIYIDNYDKLKKLSSS